MLSTNVAVINAVMNVPLSKEESQIKSVKQSKPKDNETFDYNWDDESIANSFATKSKKPPTNP